MNQLQKWLIIMAMWIFAIGVLFSSFNGRYRWADLTMSGYNGARYDTWTGEVEVRNGLHWERGAPGWIKDVK